MLPLTDAEITQRKSGWRARKDDKKKNESNGNI